MTSSDAERSISAAYDTRAPGDHFAELDRLLNHAHAACERLQALGVHAWPTLHPDTGELTGSIGLHPDDLMDLLNDLDRGFAALTAASTSAWPPSGNRATTSLVSEGLRLSFGVSAATRSPPIRWDRISVMIAASSFEIRRWRHAPATAPRQFV